MFSIFGGDHAPLKKNSTGNKESVKKQKTTLNSEQNCNEAAAVTRNSLYLRLFGSIINTLDIANRPWQMNENFDEVQKDFNNYINMRNTFT